MWTKEFDASVPEEGIQFLQKYANWPAWRRWIFRNLGR